MAVKREQLVNDSEAARSRPIELITENGFSIVRLSDVDRAKTQSTGSYSFVVHDPDEYVLEINVEIDPQVIEEIGRRSEGRISRESSYWISCAERHLAEYLWEYDDYPPGARLAVHQSSPDDCDLASRWGNDCKP
jgi:hypothetical protein